MSTPPASPWLMTVVVLASLPVIAVASARQEADVRPNAGPLKVTNLRSGPVCRDGPAETGRPPSNRICPGRDVLIQGRDTCVWAGENMRCTWWGFEFDYENADPDEPLTCIWQRSMAGAEGNWEGVRNTNIATDTIQVALDSTRGHHVFTGFDAFTHEYVWLTVDLDYDCTYRSEPVLAANYRLIFSKSFR